MEINISTGAPARYLYMRITAAVLVIVSMATLCIFPHIMSNANSKLPVSHIPFMKSGRHICPDKILRHWWLSERASKHETNPKEGIIDIIV